MNFADRTFVVFLLGLGYVVMFLFGRAYQKIISARDAHQTTKKLVPVLRRAFWAVVRSAVLIALAACVVVLALGLYASTGPKAAPTPSSSVRPSPSRTR